TVPLSPRRISEPWPKSRSIWVTAASSAASLALASFADASFKFTFLSAIWITSLPPARGQLDMGQQDVSRTPWLKFRTVERHPDAKEGLPEPLGKGTRTLGDGHRASPLVAHPGYRHVRPKGVVLGLIEAHRPQPRDDARLQLLGALGVHR